jgi:pimeloyl-ACP methyl ester carboxylesterase
MRGGEIRSLGEVAGESASRPAVVARDVHATVAGRVFGRLGAVAAPVRVLHDGISSAAYRTAATALQAGLSAGGRALAFAAPPRSAPLGDSTAGSLALGALNGVLGDRLARDHPDLALEMTVRRGGRDLPRDPEGLAAAFPDAGPKLAVFVHGLCETDEAWRLVGTSGERTRPVYGDRLRDELGYSPLYVRYNTGLHISDNGRRLASLLDGLVSAWPVDVDEIALIGHSMGGLVSRSACHYGGLEGHRWTEHLRHVFCLGAPHLGAPLEKAANVAGWALSRFPESRPFGDLLLRDRSVGIKDLRYGNCIEEDWRGHDPDELLRDRCREVPFLRSATYYFVAATLSRRSEGLGGVAGDLLVTHGSASGRGRRRRIPFEIENGRHVGGLNHFQLLNHPSVYAQIREWLERAPCETAPGLS